MQNTNKFWQLLELCDATLFCSGRGIQELIIYLAGEWYIRIVRSSWYLCSGHSGKCHGPLSKAPGLMIHQIPGSIHFDDDDLIRFRGGLIMPSHLRYHCRHAGTMIAMYNVLRLSSNCVIACTAKKREMPSRRPDEKQQNTLRHRQIDGHMVWNSMMFLPANDEGWWWLSVFSTPVQGLWRCKWASKNISFPQSTYLT